jgi:hypothetical protein
MASNIVDVKTLANLETAARAFHAALKSAAPANERLEAAGYPGADALDFGTLDEALNASIEALEDLRLADGDQGIWDYRFQVIRLGHTLNEASAYFYKENEPERVEPMRRYAQSLAS